jgi:hypothetical protein
MDNYGYLDFKVISQTPFKKVFDALALEYREENGKLIADNAIVDINKNLFFNPHNKKEGGSCIKFVELYKACSLREAAFFISELCGAPAKEEKKIPELTLTYHPYLAGIAPEDLCKSLNVGFCKEKSIMAKHICFKVGEHYIGYEPEKQKWLFPKNFKRDTLWNIENCDSNINLVCRNPFTALKLVAKGYSYAASIMGTAPTEEQKEIVKRYEFAFYD